MPKIDIDIIVSALSAGNTYEQMKISLQIATNPEEYLLLLMESFKIKEQIAIDLESGIKGPIAELDYSFIEQIRKIRENKDGLAAFIFSMKHFGLMKTEETMSKVFDIKNIDRYKPFLTKFLEWSPQIASIKSKSEKSTSHKKESIVPDFGNLKLKAERVVKPAITIQTKLEVMAVYAQQGNDERLMSLVPSHGKTVPLTLGAQLQNGWSVKNKSTLGAYIRENKKVHIIDIKKEGIARRVLFYNK